MYWVKRNFFVTAIIMLQLLGIFYAKEFQPPIVKYLAITLNLLVIISNVYLKYLDDKLHRIKKDFLKKTGNILEKNNRR